MSLDTVVEDIRDEARARAEEISSDADERADEIVAEAEADAEEIRAERQAAVEREIEQEREQKLSSAKLEAKQERLEARRDILEGVREQVEEEISNIEGDKREELTRTLLEAAAREFDDDTTVEVYGRAEDAALLESILEEYDDYELAGEYECLGGVVVDSDSSRISVNNTFDSVLDEVWENNLRDISSRLFEEQ
ncbi:V-type ATP synthase subunit E [Halobacteriales archaeon QS_4_62_28]|nr:MAG: V-type ATP synthase subunit E [Halobacteriales archaeon QS_4_62_28]